MQALPFLFQPSDLSETLPSSSVERIFIAASTATSATATGRNGLPASPNALSNHWAIFLVTDHGSARIDPQPSSADNNLLQLTITLEDAPSETPGAWGEVFRYELPARQGLKTENVLEAIDKANFGRYRMHSSGHGRRYWVWHLLSFMKEVRFIDDSSIVNGARIRLQQVWIEGADLAPEEQQTNMVHGEFF